MALLAMVSGGYFGVYAYGQANPDDNGPHHPPPRIEDALRDLNLTSDQQDKVDPIVKQFHEKQRQLHEEMLKQLKDVLTPQQYEKFASSTRPPPPPGQGDQNGPPPNGPPPGPPPDGDQNAPPPATQPQADASKLDVMPSPSANASQVPVQFTGGHDTDPRDGGRPVILIASALGVSSDVFRDAFSRVHPAGPGSGGPTDAEARQNKQVLMQKLSPYGITDDRLNAVSNFYRYSRSRGEMWRNTPATAYATVQNGKIVALTVTNPGAGYTTPPIIAVDGMPDVKIAATLAFGTDFKTNGSVKSLAFSRED